MPPGNESVDRLRGSHAGSATASDAANRRVASPTIDAFGGAASSFVMLIVWNPLVPVIRSAIVTRIRCVPTATAQSGIVSTPPLRSAAAIADRSVALASTFSTIAEKLYLGDGDTEPRASIVIPSHFPIFVAAANSDTRTDDDVPVDGSARARDAPAIGRLHVAMFVVANVEPYRSVRTVVLATVSLLPSVTTTVDAVVHTHVGALPSSAAVAASNSSAQLGATADVVLRAFAAADKSMLPPRLNSIPTNPERHVAFVKFDGTAAAHSTDAITSCVRQSGGRYPAAHR